MAEDKKAEDPGDSTRDGDGAKDRKAGKIEISTPQVAGGALASVTAAFLGSQLGVVGTVWGAGLTSVVITVGGALYQRSLEKTRNKANLAAAKAALKRSTSQSPVGMLPKSMQNGPGQDRSEQDGFGQDRSGQNGFGQDRPRPQESQDGRATSDLGIDPARTRWIRPLESSGLQWPGGEHVIDDAHAAPEADPKTRVLGQARAEPRTELIGAGRSATKIRRVRWAVLAATSAMMFGLGMLVVTGFEGITGKPLSGGETGTTLGRVFRPAPQPASEAPEPEAPEQPSTPEPVQPSESPSVEPSSSPEPETTTREPAPTSTVPTSPGTTAEMPTSEPSTAPSVPRETGVIGENNGVPERR